MPGECKIGSVGLGVCASHYCHPPTHPLTFPATCYIGDIMFVWESVITKVRVRGEAASNNNVGEMGKVRGRCEEEGVWRE